MNEQFVHYVSTTEKDDIQPLILLLEQNGIDYRIEEELAEENPTFHVNNHTMEYFLHVKEEDYEKTAAIEREYFQSISETIPTDYYLFSFSNNELDEVLKKSDEWSNLDAFLAQKILATRGIVITQETIDTAKKERLEELAIPDNYQLNWVVLGYVFAVLGGYALTWIISLILGTHLLKSKKTLPNKEKVYRFNEHGRQHGARILILGISVFIIRLLLLFLL
jgi:hypothetical protein